MSYEISIKGVSTDLDISEEESISLLIRIMDEIGYQAFTRRIFEGRFSSQEVSSFLTHFNSILEERITYECLVHGEQEIADSINTLCSFCNASTNGNSNHETEILYLISKPKFKSIIAWLNEEEKKMYFLPQYKGNMNELIEMKKRIIPFVGSGLSIPFGIPDWGGLIKAINPDFEKQYHKDEFLDQVKNGEFMEALDLIKTKSFTITTEKQLQRKIVSIIKNKELPHVENDNHNYVDLLKLNSNFYITTNYDLILSKKLTENYGYTTPVSFNDIDDTFSIHAGENKVLHLHGHIDKDDQMVVSEESYKGFYNNQDNKTKLASLIGSKKLLFIGFSFQDAFFEDLYHNLNNVIGNEHYIIVANPDGDKAREFLKKNLRVIGLKVKTKPDGRFDSQDYVKALRLLLHHLENA
ncbi:SIR2 family NAD-dependent protein deacylase [Peribacillus simplex]|uniref:SIR2-like domain-containing protein n=1 Tax=Peribacillus simplex TaxID=1478 RepID=A0AAN2TRG7_9BACI|nr:SIR2 family protein [Peribacillus simplex]CEG31078.1 hypothetical protein BN1180_01214 [Peribacillus simplex]